MTGLKYGRFAPKGEIATAARKAGITRQAMQQRYARKAGHCTNCLKKNDRKDRRLCTECARKH